MPGDSFARRRDGQHVRLQSRRAPPPNEFDIRLGTENHRKIRKALQPVNDHVQALLFSLSTTRELDPGETYALRVMILTSASALNDNRIIEMLETSKDRIEEIISGREGIELSGVAILSDAQITLQQAIGYSNWGFEDLSIEADHSR